MAKQPLAPARRAPPARLPTAYDVARIAGVSQSAVSRAFTPGASISPEARLKVFEAAKGLGYRPNLIARSLITQRSGMIGVAIAYMENQFYPAILEALSTAFAGHGYRVLLFTPGPDGNPDPILDEVLRYRVEAVILASTTLTSHFAEECAQARVPVVMLNRKTETAAASSVTGENFRGGREIAKFLASGGHRRFAFVAGLEDSSTSREREEGFREFLAEAGAKTPLRVVGNYNLPETILAARKLLSDPDRPDAIFCANDHTAFAVMDTARSEFGLRIGQDVSIIGFDDVPLAAWPAFNLTTYSQPIRGLVDHVVTVTLQHLSEDVFAPVHETVGGGLVIRGSARPPL
jgi:DNA-binding LacI/PurR family transcriptional regulator